MKEKIENLIFYGIPCLIVLIVVMLFLFRTPRHVAEKREMEGAYKLLKAQKYQEAVPIISKKARLNNCDAQFMLYKLLMEGKHVKKDEQQALRWLQESARSGHPAAQYHWGQHLLKSNPARAEFYLKSARKAGYKE